MEAVTCLQKVKLSPFICISVYLFSLICLPKHTIVQTILHNIAINRNDTITKIWKQILLQLFLFFYLQMKLQNTNLVY
jgi:hypothetical protein